MHQISPKMLNYLLALNTKLLLKPGCSCVIYGNAQIKKPKHDPSHLSEQRLKVFFHLLHYNFLTIY